jgi:hypothetical protein
MNNLFGTHLFSIGERSYYWEDVFVAARLWGDWTALQRQVREGIACAKVMLDEDCDLDPAELQSAADEFRYERNLLSREEAETWLKERGLTVEMWSEYILRWALRRKWSADLDDIVVRGVVTDAEIEEAITCEAICSGRLHELANELAGRAAVYERVEEQLGDHDLELAPVPVRKGIASELADLGLPGFPLEFWQERVDFLARVDAAFQSFSGDAGLPDLGAEVAAHHLDWIVVDYELVPFRDEEAAREAALCVRTDGAKLAEVARRAGSADHRTTVFLEQADTALRSYLLGARDEEVLGPFRWREGFAVLRVIAKKLPSIDDPRIRDRARRSALAGAVKREILDRVRWA